MGTSDDRTPERKPSFWSTLPGVLTALGTAVGAAATLMTTLYSVGVIGAAKPKATAAEVVTAAASSAAHPELEEAKKKIEKLARQKQTAEEARARAEAEAARVRREQAAAAAKELEAKKQAELEAARQRTEEAETARLRAEAEAEHLRREQTAAAARARMAALQEQNVARAEPRGGPPRLRNAIRGFRVVGSRGAELLIEVDYSYDPSHGGPIVAGAMLRYQGRPISGYRPMPVTQEAGTARIPVVVRGPLGRQSDELEIFLLQGPRKLVARTFPFVRTFETGRSENRIDSPAPGYRPTIEPARVRMTVDPTQEAPHVKVPRGSWSPAVGR